MPPRLRSALSAVLITLSCLLVPFGALALWATYGLTDTGRYVTTMAPLATDPDVREAIADAVGDSLLHEAGGRLDTGPLRGSVRPFVHDAVRSFTQTQAFRLAWDAGNRVTHDAVLRALRDDRDEAAAEPVTVDFAPVTAQVKQQLSDEHIPLAARIPVQHTAVAVLPADELTSLRKGFQVLEVAGFWLPLAAVAFAAAGIALAVRRRRAIAATALGTALGGALLGLAVAVGRALTLAGLPGDVPRPAAGAVYDALTGTLRTVSWLLLGLGLTVALTTWLTRNLRPARLVRRLRGPKEPAPAPAQEPTRVQA
ncbi:hypothetical protein ACFY2H_20145 [Streptomyces griseofuscus]|uniref:Integral membrane protein n=1 Tax=Streptomyces griseofuscus TaxID=146922 RepID=A0A7H1Q1A2_9ACTN|nr:MULTISPECIES: hypothetical protein [Streptomyces]MBA9047032.1 hypothetical protein [Streptomyces murinus]QNT94082.1 hypothetical protein HEP81_03784 [Streptomyces griseofuscus]BBC94747.1 hypothetical protein SRO_3571 [Streptomyces rochei]